MMRSLLFKSQFRILTFWLCPLKFYRLLKPPPQFVGDPEMRALAATISREIYQESPNVRLESLCNAPYCLFNTLLCYTILYTILYYTVYYNPIYCIVLYYIILYYIIPYYIIPYYTILYYTIYYNLICCTVLYCFDILSIHI